ncbi:MAG: hypothetical protein K2Y56_06735 [Methylobacterium sp.]|uniref:hypothetical protein n=1 Tax=Methylobacterium sp. TaxID=409 RepID=UPI0025EBA6D3|nr:hypothetical protein [Methylobacterium sp.]MBX9931219.1 hypothetical protein [Methylobacterium sp.]
MKTRLAALVATAAILIPAASSAQYYEDGPRRHRHQHEHVDVYRHGGHDHVVTRRHHGGHDDVSDRVVERRHHHYRERY